MAVEGEEMLGREPRVSKGPGGRTLRFCTKGQLVFRFAKSACGTSRASQESGDSLFQRVPDHGRWSVRAWWRYIPYRRAPLPRARACNQKPDPSVSDPEGVGRGQ